MLLSLYPTFFQVCWHLIHGCIQRPGFRDIVFRTFLAAGLMSSSVSWVTSTSSSSGRSSSVKVDKCLNVVCGRRGWVCG